MNFWNFLTENGGLMFAIFGAALAALLAGIGSAKGVGLVGQAATGVVSEDPEKFGKSIILQVIPGTQGFYGFVTCLVILSKIGLLSGNVKQLTLGQGFLIFLAALPAAFVEYRSAIYQGETAAAGIEILAKRPEKFFDAVIYAVMVETYAVLALITSLIMVLFIKI